MARPSSYKEDGDYQLEEIEDLLYMSDFENEREFVDFIHDKLDDVIGKKVVSVEREVTIPKNVNRNRARFRLDILAEDEDGKVYIIECKCPKYNGSLEVVLASAQVQFYGDIYEKLYNVSPKKIVLTTKINDFTCHHYKRRYPDVSLVVAGRGYTAGLR